jgi:hypothetical protein
MEHFSNDEWIDFAREVGGRDKAKTVKMREHLDHGCIECSKTLEKWRHIVNFANRENAYEPPAWALQAARTSFILHKTFSAEENKGRKFEIARLLFDSSLQPRTAGVRGTASVVRQLLYRSGSLCIDMRMQPRPGSQSMVLIGQLLDSAKPDHGISDIPVSLLCKGDTLSKSRTNDVGEFDFGITAADHLQLVFGIADTRNIVVPVPDGESIRGLVEA